MNEVDLLAALEFRTEMTWNIFQWWVGISTAVMVASYLGADKLTRTAVVLIIGMYAFGSYVYLESLLNNAAYITDVYESLSLLSEETTLSLMGNGTLERRAGLFTSARAYFIGFLFLFTLGFVIYSYKYIRTKE